MGTLDGSINIVIGYLYSTIQQLKDNCPQVEESNISDNRISKRIAMADRFIDVKLSNVIDIDALHTYRNAGTTPDVINTLSQYKSAELILVSIYGNMRVGGVDGVPADITTWKAMFDDLLKSILNGKVKVIAHDGTSLRYTQGSPSVDVTTDPFFGTDKYGQYDEDLDAPGASGSRNIN